MHCCCATTHHQQHQLHPHHRINIAGPPCPVHTCTRTACAVGWPHGLTLDCPACCSCPMHYASHVRTTPARSAGQNIMHHHAPCASFAFPSHSSLALRLGRMMLPPNLTRHPTSGPAVSAPRCAHLIAVALALVAVAVLSVVSLIVLLILRRRLITLHEFQQSPARQDRHTDDGYGLDRDMCDSTQDAASYSSLSRGSGSSPCRRH